MVLKHTRGPKYTKHRNKYNYTIAIVVIRAITLAQNINCLPGGFFEVLLRLKYQCINYFFLKIYKMKFSLMKFYSFFLKLNYSLGEIDTKLKFIWEYFEFQELVTLKVL